MVTGLIAALVIIVVCIVIGALIVQLATKMAAGFKPALGNAVATVIVGMSVNPGFGGQSFIPAALDKLRRAREIIDHSGRAIRLEVDGGGKVENAAEVAKAGADTFVSGSAIFGQKDYRAVVAAMRAAIEGA